VRRSKIPPILSCWDIWAFQAVIGKPLKLKGESSHSLGNWIGTSTGSKKTKDGKDEACAMRNTVQKVCRRKKEAEKQFFQKSREGPLYERNWKQHAERERGVESGIFKNLKKGFVRGGSARSHR